MASYHISGLYRNSQLYQEGSSEKPGECVFGGGRCQEGGAGKVRLRSKVIPVCALGGESLGTRPVKSTGQYCGFESYLWWHTYSEKGSELIVLPQME